jgi:hypothetical protein
VGESVGKSVGKSHTERGRFQAVLDGQLALTEESQKPAISRTFGSSKRWAVLGSNQ